MSKASWREAQCDGGCGADHQEMHQVIAKHIDKREKQSEQIRIITELNVRYKRENEGMGRALGEKHREIKRLRRERDEALEEISSLREKRDSSFKDEPGLPEVVG